MLAKMHGVTIQSPKIAKLREHTFAVHELMNSGGLWRDSPVLDPLRQLAVEFRLVFTSTWRVEGQQAKKAAQHAPHLFFFGPSPLPFGGSTVLETYSSTTSRSRPRTRGESIRG